MPLKECGVVVNGQQKELSQVLVALRDWRFNIEIVRPRYIWF